MTAPSSTRSLVRKGLNAIVLTGALSAAIMAGASGAQAKPFWPHHHFWGLGMGLIGAVAASEAYAADCQWVRQYDAEGNYVGHVRVCE
jgi:hypothetical protein